MTRNWIRGAAMAAALLTTAPAWAQLNGENLLGDMGVRSGSQPEPGVYVATIYYRYFTDAIKGLEALSKKIEHEIKDLLGVSSKVKLVEPKTIQRSEGKAKRVIDKRKL